jgi:hypothetical protein
MIILNFLNFYPISSWAWQHSAAHREEQPSCQKTGQGSEASKACLISAAHFS